jgi:phage tail-like protein
VTSLVPLGAVQPYGQLSARRTADWMLRQLPVQMLSQDFFVRFVSIFQQLGTSLLDDADSVDHVADLSVAPTGTVPWLGSWIGVDSIDKSMPDELQRRIVSVAASTLTRRGTTTGLRVFLELLSGDDVELEEGGGVWRAGDVPEDTAWVRMHVRTTGLLEPAAFVEMVRDEIPAHVRAELYVGGECVWSSEEDEHW